MKSARYWPIEFPIAIQSRACLRFYRKANDWPLANQPLVLVVTTVRIRTRRDPKVKSINRYLGPANVEIVVHQLLDVVVWIV